MNVTGQRKVFFTSDTHFGHANIIKYSNRPFLADVDKAELDRRGGVWGNEPWRISHESVDLMNKEMTDQINAIVGEDDILWHLGDFSMYSESDKGYYSRCRGYRDKIKCKNVNIIWGNHDEASKIHSLFDQSYDLRSIRVPGYHSSFVLCHYALAVFNKSHKGAIHLYGHSHSHAESWLSNAMPNRRSMDVGVDNAAKIIGAYRPFSLEEILGMLESKSGFSIDHHVIFS